MINRLSGSLPLFSAAPALEPPGVGVASATPDGITDFSKISASRLLFNQAPRSFDNPDEAVKFLVGQVRTLEEIFDQNRGVLLGATPGRLISISHKEAAIDSHILFEVPNQGQLSQVMVYPPGTTNTWEAPAYFKLAFSPDGKKIRIIETRHISFKPEGGGLASATTLKVNGSELDYEPRFRYHRYYGPDLEFVRDHDFGPPRPPGPRRTARPT